ncbi:FG-GAP-like repeat-containing protein [Paenarthrobacter sp. NPDC089322]|uniref:FG-GAP-like repeat-containing protein n=1 Tax=Paenarthrobacter sp. NPDC089322 TaxID=3155065 RepID=UPI00342AD559
MMSNTPLLRLRLCIAAVAAIFAVTAAGFPSGAAPANPAPMAVAFGAPKKIEAGSPRYLQVTPNGTRAITASQSGNVAIIDTLTDKVTATADLDNVSVMKVSPDGAKVFLATYLFDSHVAILDTATAALSANVAVDGQIQDLAVSPDGSTVYATIPGPRTESGPTPGSLTVIDVATASVRAVVPLGNDPGQVLLASSQAKAFVTSTSVNTIWVVNTATNALAATIPLAEPTHGGSMSPDGTKIYYPRFFGDIAIVGISTNSVVGEIATQSPANIPVFTPDGRRAFTVDKTPDRWEGRNLIVGTSFLAEIDLVANTLNPISLTNGGPTTYWGPLNVTISPDGTRLFAAGRGITVLNLPSLKAVGNISLDLDIVPGTLTMLPDSSKGYFLPGQQRTYLWAIPTPRVETAWKDYNSDGATDVLARDSAGALWLYPGNANKGWLPRSQVGTGWNVMNLIVAPGDFNSDGASDVLARDAGGDLWLYPGDGDSDWLPRSKVGVGWNAMTAVVGPGDFDFDGKADIVARDGAGDLWLYPGNGAGGWLPRTKIGSGWNVMTAILGPGNNVGPGNDLLARDTDGILWLYQRDTAGQWLPRQLVGVGWNVMSAIVTPGDFDGDEVPDILARDSAGTLWLYPGSTTGGYKPRVQVGAGWNVMTAIL